jgi:CBS domain-containing protein
MDALVSCDETATIHQVFKQLIEARILSLPVIDSQSDTRKVLALVSMFDLLAFFLSRIPEADFADPERVQSVCVKAGDECIMALVDSLASRREPMAIVSPTASLWELIIELHRCKAHRALVADQEGRIQTLVTQSRILAFMAALIDNDPAAAVPVGQVGSDFVVTAHENEKAHLAFKRMLVKHVSGMPVLDNDGKLIGNLSVSDFKLCDFQENKFWGLLSGTVGQYLHALELYSYDASIRSGVVAWLPSRASIVTCRESDSLGKVIKLLVFYRLHHVFVTNDEKKAVPSGIHP